MNPNWHNFLTKHGATIDAGVVQDFGDTTAELSTTAQNTVLCDLGQFGTLRVSGEESQSFLQNLLSNDILEVSATRAQLSSFNTAKGRVLATMLIWCENDDYLLQLPRLLCEPIRKKLSMYVLRAKVKITNTSDDIILMGLSGINASEILLEQFSELPLQQLGLARGDSGSVIRIDSTRLQIITTLQHAPTLWASLDQQVQAVGSVCWDWLDIRSGFPVMQPQTQEQFVAQMINFELIGGVNFNKGCYPGQEIVVRMQYLGKLKRRMYLAHLNGSDTPQPGDELFSAEMEGQACGMIVNSAPAPDGGYDLLATVQITTRKTQTVYIKSLQGETLEFLSLPYPLPDI